MTNLELIKSFNRGAKKGYSGGRDIDTKKI